MTSASETQLPLEDFVEQSSECSDCRRKNKSKWTKTNFRFRWKPQFKVTPSKNSTASGEGQPDLLIADEDLNDCYVIPGTTAASEDSKSWRLVHAMQIDCPDKFEESVLSLLLSAEENSRIASAQANSQTPQSVSIHTLRIEYDSGGNWSSSDMDFHYVAHLCAFYAASNCFDRLIQLARRSCEFQSELATSASRIFSLQDKNGCSLLHAVCWGCHHQVKPVEAYAKFLQTALESGGAAVTRAAARRVDDFDFNSLELAIYLECYQLAGIFLELPGVYVKSSIHGNLITKHYLLDEYILGSHKNRFHRAPMALLTSLSTPEQIARLQESNFLQHPAMVRMGISLSVRVLLAFELLPWILCLVMLYVPLPFRYGFFNETEAALDPLAVVKCSRNESYGGQEMLVTIHAGVMLTKEDVEKRIRYALGMSSDRLQTLINSSEFCSSFGLNKNLQFGVHHYIQFIGLFVAALILFKAILFPLRAIVSIAISHCQLKWRSVRYRHLYERRTQRTDVLHLVCLFCWISYWLFAMYFNTSIFAPCPFSLVPQTLCGLFEFNGIDFTTSEAMQSVKQFSQQFDVISQTVGCFLHTCALCVNLLFLYMMESAPVFGETVMMFRQVLERFMQLSLIYIICIVIFTNLFWAQTVGILHQVGADLGQFGSMDLASFLGEFYRIFTTSLNLFDPTTRQFGNSTLTMEFKKTEIRVLHFVYILMFAILTLNFLIAALVSFIDRVARSKSTMHFLHRLQRANRVRYGVWHKLCRLGRLMLCDRRNRTLEVRSTVSDSNRASWVDLNLTPPAEINEATVTEEPAVVDNSSTLCTIVNYETDQHEDSTVELTLPESVVFSKVTTNADRRCKTAWPAARSGSVVRRRKSSF